MVGIHNSKVENSNQKHSLPLSSIPLLSDWWRPSPLVLQNYSSKSRVMAITCYGAFECELTVDARAICLLFLQSAAKQQGKKQRLIIVHPVCLTRPMGQQLHPQIALAIADERGISVIQPSSLN